MPALLSDCEAGYLLLGEDSEHPVSFYSVIVRLGMQQLRRYGIGISSEGHGLTPVLHLQPDQERLIFGFNSHVVGVSLPRGVVSLSLALDSLFYRFLPLPTHKMLLIQHEIGVVMLTEAGDLVWKFSKDVTTSIRVDDDRLVLEFLDSEPIQFDILSGTVH